MSWIGERDASPYRNVDHLVISSFMWDVNKQCRPKRGATERSVNQGLHCLITDFSVKIV